MERVWLSSPHMSGHEMKYIEEAFRNNHVFPLGPNVAGFEEDLRRYTGAGHCSCLSSGTAAIHLALIALGVEEGDEVICSTFTFSASANPIVYLKATPVFVESEAGTWNIRPTDDRRPTTDGTQTDDRGPTTDERDKGEKGEKGEIRMENSEFRGTRSREGMDLEPRTPKPEPTSGNPDPPGTGLSLRSSPQPTTDNWQPTTDNRQPVTSNQQPATLRSAIRDRIRLGRKPKAIIVVHLYGMPARMDEIMKVAKEYGIPVIEDAAEALGSKFDGQHCGTFGEIGILSFNGNKIITTSGGGAMISDKKEYCDLATFLATQARDKAPHYQHSHIGYNYRMSNICAGIGRGQMEVLEQRVEKRRENFFHYKEAFRDLPGISFLEEPDGRFFSNHWLTTILVDPDLTGGITREDIRLGLEKKNIETRPLWKPMHLQPVFSDCPAYVDGTSERLFNIGLCLPSSSNITDGERDFVVENVRQIVNRES